MTQPNAEQIAYWNELSGPKWVSLADTIDAQLEPLGFATMDLAGVRAGERVLDVGCGCGQTSLELARRVGPEGGVLGIDVSGPMLEDARARCDAAGLSNLDFVQADAQTHAFDAERFDLLFSRFGVMFFEDPPAAFANLRTALADDGRLCFVCWQEIGRNPWMVAPAMSAAKHIEMPPRPPEGAPGPFAFADAGHVTKTLEAAGFSGVSHQALEGEMAVGAGRSLEEIVAFMLQLGPAGAAMRDAGEAAAAQVLATATEDLRPFYQDGAVRMPFAAWQFTANT